jgi:hypothetical protein
LIGRGGIAALIVSVLLWGWATAQPYMVASYKGGLDWECWLPATRVMVLGQTFFGGASGLAALTAGAAMLSARRAVGLAYGLIFAAPLISYAVFVAWLTWL